MREITVLSGKGGTGKTTITASLAALARNCILCDNDVDASDLHLILDPAVKETQVFKGAWISKINHDQCVNCGICAENCRYDAIDFKEDTGYFVNELTCEGCRLCERVCPQQAIQSEQSLRNKWYLSDTRFGSMVHANLAPGEENSGKLVTVIRQKARTIGEEFHKEYLINDGPPGIGCSTIASVTGTDAVLLVIEPTLSGLHDVKRLSELVSSFNIPQFAIINKYDINAEVTQEVIHYLEQENIPLLGEIPYDQEVVKAMLVGKSIIEYSPDSTLALNITKSWNTLCSKLDKLSLQ